MNAIEFVERAASESEARAMLSSLASQVDYLGGRVLSPSPAKPGWRVQALFEDAPEVAADLLPDGCRRVLLIPAVARQFGISVA